MFVPLNSFKNKQLMVIDLDTGTVLGTNLRVVEVPESETKQDDIESDQEVAFQYAIENGTPLFVELNLQKET